MNGVKKPTVSLIVPVYRVENELPRCIKSLCLQTYRDFEVILVDDGSPDQCPALCDMYAEKYPWICSLHKENGGLSDARNAGVKIAHGDYITFVDSDDWVSPRYLQSLVTPIIEHQADISVVDFQSVSDENEICDCNIKDGTASFMVMDAKEVLIKVLYQKYRDVSAWGILLSRHLARKYPFPKGKLFEDLYTTYHYYLSVKKVAVISERLYYYYQRPGSIMGKRNDAFVFDLEESSRLIVMACREDPNLLRAAKSKRFSNYCRVLALVPDLKKRYPNIHHRVVEIIKEDRWEILWNSSTRMKNKIAALASVFGERGIQGLYRFKSK
ncbi:glycosyltransferase family 2 protein [Mitsuokella sp. UBA4253]|uniref:glycosyltransferase family 2 protein n=1 Tax=Mitsuokella sp. UBA4253 TaxID=1946959 RepID=UPI00257B6A00|nr:glycosyltransferase family 2 protein [Mitsuokella sp. UBA4253]